MIRFDLALSLFTLLHMYAELESKLCPAGPKPEKISNAGAQYHAICRDHG